MTAGPGRVGVLVMAHGTPARLDDVAAFYTEIRRGRAPSDAEVAELVARYRAIGGTSPLNEITRAQADGIAAALEQTTPRAFTVRVGSRFSAPRIEEAVAALAGDGCDAVVGLVLTPHSSTASVAEYERRARAALSGVGAPHGRDAPRLVMVDHWFDAPGFAALVASRVGQAMGGLDRPVVVFSAHSVPATVVEAGDTYPTQVAESAAAAAQAAGLGRFEVAWQSAGRSGGTWIGPDIRDVVMELARRGERAVVVCPIGFVADHLEVLYDIDVEVRAVAEGAGLGFARTASFNADPAFCALLAGVVQRAQETAAP